MPSKVYNLTGNGSSNKVGTKSNIRRVGKTSRGGGYSVDWVGCGKSTKVVEPGDEIEYSKTNDDLFKMLKIIMQ